MICNANIIRDDATDFFRESVISLASELSMPFNMAAATGQQFTYSSMRADMEQWKATMREQKDGQQ